MSDDYRSHTELCSRADREHCTPKQDDWAEPEQWALAEARAILPRHAPECRIYERAYRLTEASIDIIWKTDKP